MDERENKIKYRQAFSRLTVPDDMADRVMSALGGEESVGGAADERAAFKVVSVERRVSQAEKRPGRKKHFRMAVSAAAACLVAAVGIFAVNGPMSGGALFLITDDDTSAVSEQDHRNTGAVPAHRDSSGTGVSEQGSETQNVQNTSEKNTNEERKGTDLSSGVKDDPANTGNVPHGGSGAAAAGTEGPAAGENKVVQSESGGAYGDLRGDWGSGEGAGSGAEDNGQNSQAGQPSVVDDEELPGFDEEFITGDTGGVSVGGGERIEGSGEADAGAAGGSVSSDPDPEAVVASDVPEDTGSGGSSDQEEGEADIGVENTLSPAGSVIHLADVSELSGCMDFSPVLPDKTYPGWVISTVDVIFGVAQIMYKDAEGDIVTYRTARTSEDISGSTADYPETKTRGSFKFNQKNDSEVSLVTWTDSNYSYSLLFTPPVNTESAYHWARSIERAASAAE